jgi:hypothetical protein
MANDDKSANDRDPKFSFGVRELNEAQTAQRGSRPDLTLESAPRKAANEKRGFDPYNTSGSFDRKKHWTRVGKR